jgi:hypothetical protein
LAALQHNKSIRKALQKYNDPSSEGGASPPSSREEEKRGLTLAEFSMLYFAPSLKKHHGKAAEDLALTKVVAGAASTQDGDVFSGGTWGSGSAGGSPASTEAGAGAGSGAGGGDEDVFGGGSWGGDGGAAGGRNEGRGRSGRTSRQGGSGGASPRMMTGDEGERTVVVQVREHALFFLDVRHFLI